MKSTIRYAMLVVILIVAFSHIAQSDWNKGLPLGTKAANLLDDDVRENNDALETALSEEHIFSTGGDQTGKHAFAVETKTTRDADSDYVAGSVSIVTDEVSGEYVFTYFDGTDWHTVLAPFLNNANDWVKGQYVTPKALTAGATIGSNLADGNVFTVTLDQNATLASPSDIGSYSGKSGVWFYVITQDDPARTLNFGISFAGDNKTISTVANSVNVFQCVLDAAGKLQTTLINTPFATNAEAAAGTVNHRPMTPANHNSTSMGAGTGVSGWCYLNGQSSGGKRFIQQWISVTTDADPDTITWPVAFANANYTVTYSNDNNWSSWSNKTTTTITIDTAGGIGTVVDLVAIGEEP